MKTFFLLSILTFSFGASASQSTRKYLPGNSVPVRIHLLSDGTITLSGQPLGSVADLNKLKPTVQNIFAERKRGGVYYPNRQSSKAEIDRQLARQAIVEVNSEVRFADLLRVLLAVRDSGAKPLGLLIADHQSALTVSIPVLADADENISNLMPNPLTLVVAVSADGLYLNGDAQESQRALLERLGQVFRQRKIMKAYRPGSNEVEATLFLKADPSLTFSKVVELLRALKRAGANPLGLQIDDLPSHEINPHSKEASDERRHKTKRGHASWQDPASDCS